MENRWCKPVWVVLNHAMGRTLEEKGTAGESLQKAPYYVSALGCRAPGFMCLWW